MERKHQFVVGEYYHVYNRGVNKNHIFFNVNDYVHFQRLLYTRNSLRRIDSGRVKGLPLHKIKQKGTIVDIVAYAMMPNHFHLLLFEKKDFGISNFMKKFGTAYSMYVNTKYSRSGPLMCHPFRSKHVDSDVYLRWLFNYIHLNPFTMDNEEELKDNDSTNVVYNKSEERSYPFSSYHDYYLGERDEGLILNQDKLLGCESDPLM